MSRPADRVGAQSDAVSRRAPVAEDLLGLTFVSDPQVSPDGRTVAAVVTTIVGSQQDDPVGAGNGGKGEDAPPRYRSRVHLFPVPDETAATNAPALEAGADLEALSACGWRPLSGAGGKEFTRSAHRDSSPRFSPDGTRLAFLRAAAEKERPQLHVIELGGGEPVQLTAHRAGVGEFVWHPDGRSLVYVSRGETVEDEKKDTGRRITRMRYRFDGEGFLPTAAADLYTIGLDGEPNRLTDTPQEQAFGAPSGPAFSPDGQTLYFCRAADERSYDDFLSDVLALDLGSQQVSVVLSAVRGVGGLAVSPSGRTLSFTAASDQDDAASPTGVWLLDLVASAADKVPRLLTGDDDASPAEASDSRFGRHQNRPTWLAAERLVVNLHREGRSGLVELGLGGETTDIHGPPHLKRAVTAFDAHPSGALAFVAEAPVRPGELWFRDARGEERRLSAFNDAWCERLELRLPAGPFPLDEQQSPGPSGQAESGPPLAPTEYWTLAPAAARLDGAVVLEVHGGPHTAYGNGFMFEFQLLAGEGYHVVYGNPRGSSSYGHHFATCMLGAYGSIDADDVLAMATAATGRMGLSDAPLHLTGGSYGGFMTNWLVGVSDRFRSAVSQRSISNWTSFYGTSDIGPSFTERELCGVPWNDVELLWRQSPLRNVAAIATPLLLIHSEEDYRCPIEQAEQLFSAIKRHGTCEVELLRFPGEGHELSRSGRPDRRIRRLEAIVDWFESHA